MRPAHGLGPVNEGLKRPAHVAVQLPAFRGRHDAATLAREQRHAQIALEELDLVTDRRVGHAQLFGSLAHAQSPGRRLEALQGVQRREFP